MSNRAELAFVFPGQGSQSIGMLSELAQHYACVKLTFDEAAEACHLDLWTIAQQGPESELSRTEITQPALLAAGVAVWRVWKSHSDSPLPTKFSGHSLGEYTALVCADALSLSDAAMLVHERGHLMQQAVPQGVGAMAAILGADDAIITAVCEEAANHQVVAPANYNSPGQTVIAGHTEAVDRAIELLAERGVRKAVKLPVSVPSHCSLMRPAANILQQRMADLNWTSPLIPVVQNADARAYSTITEIQDALARQLYLPVRWTECIQALTSSGITRIGECGPGKVLSGLLKRIDKTVDARPLATIAELNAAYNHWRAL